MHIVSILSIPIQGSLLIIIVITYEKDKSEIDNYLELTAPDFLVEQGPLTST